MTSNTSQSRSMNGINQIEVSDVIFDDGSSLDSTSELAKLNQQNIFTNDNVFTKAPTCSVEPSTLNDLTKKSYVDDISNNLGSLIAINTAKVGITQSQADAITTNTAKIGITQSQADAITANTSKIGITQSQADAITINTAKVGISASAQTITGEKTFSNDVKIDTKIDFLNTIVEVGKNNTTSNSYITAIGSDNTASGTWGTSAIGYDNTATGNYSTAMGASNSSSGQFSTTIGKNNQSSGTQSQAVGIYNQANGTNSCSAFGSFNIANGNYSTAIGYQNTSGNFSSSIGYNNNASGVDSVACGYLNKSTGNYSTALGHENTSGGLYSTAIGYKSQANNYGTAIGYKAQSINGDLYFGIKDCETAGVQAYFTENNNKMSLYVPSYVKSPLAPSSGDDLCNKTYVDANSGSSNPITSAAFNTTDGVLTLTKQDATAITADIDGRYLTSVPDLDTSKITTGTFHNDRIPVLTNIKIPDLDASKITTGTFSTNRIPALSYVETTGDETIDGEKTFTDDVKMSSKILSTNDILYIGLVNTTTDATQAYFYRDTNNSTSLQVPNRVSVPFHPVSQYDLANKSYVDSVIPTIPPIPDISGVSIKIFTFSNSTQTFYTDTTMYFRWDSSNLQPQYQPFGNDNWWDIYHEAPSSTNSNVGSMATTFDDVYSYTSQFHYFTPSGSHNSSFNLKNYGQQNVCKVRRETTQSAKNYKLEYSCGSTSNIQVVLTIYEPY